MRKKAHKMWQLAGQSWSSFHLSHTMSILTQVNTQVNTQHKCICNIHRVLCGRTLDAVHESSSNVSLRPNVLPT